MRSFKSLMMAGATVLGLVVTLSSPAKADDCIGRTVCGNSTLTEAPQGPVTGRKGHRQGFKGPLGHCPASLGCGCNMAEYFGISAAVARAKGLWVARSWATEGSAATKGCIKCVAVLTRGRRGGHVGIVEGYDPHGNPIIYSYHNARQGWGTATYSSSRVIGYRNI